MLSGKMDHNTRTSRSTRISSLSSSLRPKPSLTPTTINSHTQSALQTLSAARKDFVAHIKSCALDTVPAMMINQEPEPKLVDGRGLSNMVLQWDDGSQEGIELQQLNCCGRVEGHVKWCPVGRAEEEERRLAEEEAVEGGKSYGCRIGHPA